MNKYMQTHLKFFMMVGLLATTTLAAGTNTFIQLEGNIKERLQVPPGKTALVISVYSSSAAGCWIRHQKPGTTLVSFQYFDHAPQFPSGVVPVDSASVSVSRPIIMQGPCKLEVGGPGAFFGLVLTDTEQKKASPAQEGITSTAVVIPEDATGPVEIILESSTDMINWNRANPGSYGSSTANRFFRLRAEAK